MYLPAGSEQTDETVDKRDNTAGSACRLPALARMQQTQNRRCDYNGKASVNHQQPDPVERVC